MKKIIATILVSPALILGIALFLITLAMFIVGLPILLAMLLVTYLIEDTVDWGILTTLPLEIGLMFIYLPIDYIWDTNIEGWLEDLS
jgi:hypothetical protein